MSTFTFHGMEDALKEKLGLPETAFPVRAELEAEVFQEEAVDLVALLDELDLFLEENPDCADAYRGTTVLLALLAAVAQASEGFLDASARCLEIGLAHHPENLTLRTKYALALQGLGRAEEALAQYEAVIGDPEAAPAPHLWILAARLHGERGNHARARDLLRQCADLVPEEEGFWDLLGEAEAKAGPEAVAAPVPRFCTRCGSPFVPGNRFCGSCGAMLEAPAAPPEPAPPVPPPPAFVTLVSAPPAVAPKRASWGARIGSAIGVLAVLAWAAAQYGPAVRGWITRKIPSNPARRSPPPVFDPCPPAPLPTRQEADRLIEEDRFSEAVEAFTPLIQENPQDASLLFSRGLAYDGLGQLQEALADLEASARLDPGALGPAFHRGEVLLKLGRPQEALASYDAAAGLDSLGIYGVRIRSGRAFACILLGQADRALQESEEAIRLGGSARAHYCRARALSALGRAAESVPAFEASLRMDPRNATGFNELGNVQYSLKRWQAAEKAYREAVRLAPDAGVFHANLAGSLFQQGRKEEARRAAAEAARLGVTDHWVLEALR